VGPEEVVPTGDDNTEQGLADVDGEAMVWGRLAAAVEVEVGRGVTVGAAKAATEMKLRGRGGRRRKKEEAIKLMIKRKRRCWELGKGRRRRQSGALWRSRKKRE